MNAWKKKHLVEGSKSVGVCRDGRCLGIWSYMCFMGPFCENRFPPSALNWILIIIFETIIWKSIILLGWVLRVRGVFLRGFWGKWNKLGKAERCYPCWELWPFCERNSSCWLSAKLQSDSSPSSKSFKAAHGQMWSIDEFKFVVACQQKHYLKSNLKCKKSEILNPENQCLFFRIPRNGKKRGLEK